MITGPMVQTYLLGSALAKNNWEVHFISYAPDNRRGPTDHESFQIHWIPKRRFLPLINFIRLIKTLYVVHPDLCYQRGRDILTGIAGLYCMLFDARFIFASAGEDGVERKKYRKQLDRKRRSLIKRIVLLPEAFINDVVTEFGLKASQTVFVQTAHQLERLKRVWGKSGKIVRSGHPLPELRQRQTPIKILWIGSVKQIKRPDVFVELAKLCDGLGCEFWLAGQIVDARYEWISDESSLPQNMKYLGAIPFEQSASLIGEAHLLMNTTAAGFEGFPNAFIQAWIGGTLTLSIHCDPDGVISSNDIGLVTEDLEEHKRFIERCVSDLNYWRKRSASALAFGRTFYTIDKAISEIETEYEQILPES